jgi:inosine-uridine nucleoside N-ribohydrolase
LPCRIFIVLLLLVVLLVRASHAQERSVPQFPPGEGKIRVIIDADAANEIDDQWAIALALLSPERFKIEGFVAAHYGDKGGGQGIEKSLVEINAVLKKAGMAGRFPVLRGSHPLIYGRVSQPSEGVNFIIERAMDQRETEPLWIIALGPATDLVSAYLKEPRIKNRVVAFWHGRTQWPTKAWNFNAYNDLRAVQTLFSSELPFVLFDTGTNLTIPMDEGKQRIHSHGPLGQYLHDIRLREKAWQSSNKGVFDLGDIAALVDPSLAKFEVVDVPRVGHDMLYDHKNTHGKMIRIHSIDRAGTFDLLERKLKEVVK